MKTWDIDKAGAHLASLIANVQAGEQIVIAKAGVPVARLVPIDAPSGKRTLGRDVGLPFRIDPNFDEYVPEEFAGCASDGAKTSTTQQRKILNYIEEFDGRHATSDAAIAEGDRIWESLVSSQPKP
jgi:prevent-host-death family protein